MEKFICPKEMLDNYKALIEANINLGNTINNTVTNTITTLTHKYIIELKIKPVKLTPNESIHKNISELRRLTNRL